MKLNKKGFVSSAVLYSLLLLFLALILGLLALLSNRKQILDKLKGDIKSEINQTKNYKKYENGTAIYYNTVTGKICGDYTEENSKTGVNEGCLKWYIFNDDKNKATVNMILDHNTSGNVAWASLEDYIEAGGTEEEYGENGKNIKGPLTVTKRLNEDTEKWKNKARLITADEIAKITGANLDSTIKWNSNKAYGITDIQTQSSWYFFDGSGTAYTNWQKQVISTVNSSKYSWLFDNTNGCESYGCNISDDNTYGYWTSTAVYNNTTNAWDVTYAGRLYDYNVISNGSGVRPVITITKKQIETADVYDVYDNGEIVYYNPVTGKICGDYNKNNSVTGIKEGCMKWYTFNDNINSSMVNMILDHNTTALVAYNSTGTNAEMKEAKTALENDTNNWKEKNTARLITADEVAQITKNTTFKSKNTEINGYFYFDTNTNTKPDTYLGTYAWLYNYTKDCESYGCDIEDTSNYGYWTSTPIVKNETHAWIVSSYSLLGNGNGVSNVTHYGVRPVISIPKYKINYDSFEIAYNYTGSEQSFTAPASGKYKIELWGASGGNAISNTTLTTGTGGYTSGIIELTKNKEMYIYVGGIGRRYNTTTNGGYNGGGGSLQSTSGAIGETGGGATDIRLINGVWNNFDSLKSRIMVAAGGGGSAGYNLSSVAGGLNGYDGISVSDYNIYLGKGASQISGGVAPTMLVSAQSNGTSGGFGYGGNGGASGSSSVSGGGAGAGGGYYGGSGASGLSNGTFPAGGGSSFISGHNGCDAIASTSTKDNIIHTGQSKHYSGLYFTDTTIIDGIGYKWTTEKTEYIGIPTREGTGTITGYVGNGYAKITYLGSE